MADRGRPVSYTHLDVYKRQAILGVIAAPITSGDTAFRSARLIVADFLGMEQKTMRRRLYI